jgi:hypothetical protein
MLQVCLPLFSKVQIKKIKQRTYHKQWRNNHREQWNEYGRRWKRKYPEKVKVENKRYRQSHPEQCRKNSERWRKACPEKFKEMQERWKRHHPERLNEIHKRYKQKHPEIYKESWNRYYQKNRKHVLEINKQWRRANPEKNRLHTLHNNYRRRNLGSVELNERFEDSHGHHVDKLHIINIPESLHMSINHNVLTGKGMKEINAKAFELLTEQSRTLPLLEVTVATS